MTKNFHRFTRMIGALVLVSVALGAGGATLLMLYAKPAPVIEVPLAKPEAVRIKKTKAALKSKPLKASSESIPVGG
jgi:hypothetical protein